MAQATIDVSQLREYAADMRQVSATVRRQIRPVVEHGALNIKRQMRSEMSASRYFRGAARSISYDVTERADAIEAEIGPRHGPGEPGSLANIAYFGTSRGGGTVPDPRGALEAETPRFEQSLTDLVMKALS